MKQFGGNLSGSGIRASMLWMVLCLSIPQGVAREEAAAEAASKPEQEEGKSLPSESGKPQAGSGKEAAPPRYVVFKRILEKPKALRKQSKLLQHPIQYHYSMPCPDTGNEDEPTVCVSEDPKLSELSEKDCSDLDGHVNDKGSCLSRVPCDEEEGRVEGQGECFIPLSAKQAREEFKDCDGCPPMVALPPGRFIMGSATSEPGRDKDEGPAHSVAIGRRFAMGKHEISRREYALFANNPQPREARECHAYDGRSLPGKTWRDPGFVQTSDEEPVVCVSWEDAQDYAVWLSAKTGRHYRLPTEAEWEYAARAGSVATRFWGDDPDAACAYANVADLSAGKTLAQSSLHQCVDGVEYTAPVGRYEANPFGLKDMLGNVWEWTQDCYHGTYENAPADGRAWDMEAGGDCERRVIRGGGSGMAGIPAWVRSASRGALKADHAYSMAGFRLVVDINP